MSQHINFKYIILKYEEFEHRNVLLLIMKDRMKEKIMFIYNIEFRV